MKTVRISRRRWWRGNGTGQLLNSTDKMCCLGFVCRSYGVTRKAINHVPMPADVEWPQRRKLPRWLTRHDGLASKAAGINDEPGLAEPERERRIAAIFKRRGLRAVFTK